MNFRLQTDTASCSSFHRLERVLRRNFDVSEWEDRHDAIQHIKQQVLCHCVGKCLFEGIPFSVSIREEGSQNILLSIGEAKETNNAAALRLVEQLVIAYRNEPDAGGSTHTLEYCFLPHTVL